MSVKKLSIKKIKMTRGGGGENTCTTSNVANIVTGKCVHNGGK
jgi:hypothetical protein